MKIFWLSPHADGWSLAYKMRQAGHKVVYHSPRQKNSGAEYLPSVPNSAWVDYARRSDLIICDGTFDSRPTRRSWSPSDYSLELQQLRRRGIQVVGPTPTTELLENDSRYFRKTVRKLGLVTPATATNSAGTGLRLVFSVAPTGRASLVFRHRELFADGNGPELGNLGDVVVPVGDCKLAKRLLQFAEFTHAVGHTSYINVDVTIEPSEVVANGAFSRFLYPAIFAQFQDLLVSPAPGIGLAVTLLRLEGSHSSEELVDRPDFYAADLEGEFLGAIANRAGGWNEALAEVYKSVQQVAKPGWGYRPNVGEQLTSHLQSLRNWGWI